MGLVMQPYESHIPYLLQVFQDHGLCGMGWLHSDEARMVRGPTSDVTGGGQGIATAKRNKEEEAAHSLGLKFVFLVM